MPKRTSLFLFGSSPFVILLSQFCGILKVVPPKLIMTTSSKYVLDLTSRAYFFRESQQQNGVDDYIAGVATETVYEIFLLIPFSILVYNKIKLV
ncbi:Hypothetical protein LUCI_2542 [Lucifera butyrica]|uniref:Uncharacterized protein n=1 Tax=Lucifera butyrica TaxID=1351585 RepID=A0A498RDL6_9FIRM|nr:Hypothetical protein LUCI_2542 [Lucifera butyrica]